ncbi:MAG: right-handed parallel beta-helix repeat-containing protein [Prolixibacteraceae bacterium]|nr:right-handed parallel beta-helix repeat-containing protein [Prolixibacteraceae bacterium]
MKTLKINLSLFLILLTFWGHSKEFHVAVTGNNQNDGSAASPWRTINFAAQKAQPGDVITVHTGTYRERIDPAFGGESDTRRIVYQAAPGEKVEIKGSEVITGWKKEKSGVWKVVIPNAFFGNYNPYKDSINGDWFNAHGRIHHTGEVFLNGKSLYEKEIIEKVIHPERNEKILDPEGSVYTWYCESDDQNTTIWANFQKFDPNKELVEISARPTCFYPSKPGINYLTIRGFHISQAATQWGAPTAEQVGMVATHWCKGWIIENNVIHDSKCSGITLGKERGTGHNVWTADKENINRDGNIHYIEVVFRTLRNGWNKQNVGSHIVRNNTIYNCEQTGICGSMGAVFSTIENNHIYNIYTKRQFSGAEIGGIKFHAAVDAQIRKNRIHRTGRGIWLDWMTQGTRVSGNLFYDNDMEDIFLEVNHGPFVVDNNIFLSPVAIRTQSQGGAYVHNLISGSVYMWPDLNRFTPYFLPHSTDIGALTTIPGGDDRYYNNIFVGNGGEMTSDTTIIVNPWDPKNKYKFGLIGYNQAKLPIWMKSNVYYFGAIPSKKDVQQLIEPTFNPGIKLTEDGGHVYLQMNFGGAISSVKSQLITSDLLGKAKIPKARFENADGSALKIDTDYLGNKRSEAHPTAGPFENPGSGILNLKVW